MANINENIVRGNAAINVMCYKANIEEKIELPMIGFKVIDIDEFNFFLSAENSDDERHLLVSCDDEGEEDAIELDTDYTLIESGYRMKFDPKSGIFSYMGYDNTEVSLDIYNELVID